MRYYPVFLDLQDKTILVVGAGSVGCRKIADLLAASPHRLVVVDPAPPEEALPLLEDPQIVFHKRGFTPEDLNGVSLAFAASNNTQVNSLVAELCKAQNIFCNRADNPVQSDFTVPAHVEQGPITIALGSQGTSPALTRHIRKELEQWLGNRYTALALVLGRIRPLLLAQGKSTQDNIVIFRRIVESPLASLLEKKDFTKAHELLTALLPEALHTQIGDIFHEL